jgi:hypothetical protein
MHNAVEVPSVHNGGFHLCWNALAAQKMTFIASKKTISLPRKTCHLRKLPTTQTLQNIAIRLEDTEDDNI